MSVIPKDAFERRAAAQEAVAQRPNDPAAWIALSQACQVLVDEEGTLSAARRAFELQPDNIAAIRHFAASLFQSGYGAVEARSLFERLLVLAPDDAVALHYLHYFAMFDRDYRRAIDLSEALARAHPGDPVTSARIARAHKLMGNSIAATEHFARAAALCANEHYPFPDGPYAPLMPVFTALAGDPTGSRKLSRELCQESGLGLADLSNPRYPDDTVAAIVRLQERVAARDLFIFGFGPSLVEITSRREELTSLEFASMTLSTFPLIEDNLLRPIGRRVDIVCMTHPLVVQNYAAAIREWFSAVPTAILTLPVWLRAYAALTGGPDFLLARSDHLFWFDCFSEDLPPSPVNPLHFPAVNTLMCAFSVALLARPRRIFLFGFDGQIRGGDPQKSGALYFNELHESYHTPRRTEPEVRRLTQALLWWNSLRFNEFAPIVERHLTLLFDLPLPPTYNVCIDSAVDSFPRIPFGRFRQIVASEAAGQ